MKEKVITFIIGFLIGAIVATAGFYMYMKLSKNDAGQTMDQPSGMESMQVEPPSQPNGGNGEPPAQPNGENGEPPAKPDDNNEESNERGDAFEEETDVF